jgi:lipopolysaccharide export system protein LptC
MNRYWVLLTLLAGVIVTFWLAARLDAEDSTLAPKLSHDPDYFMENFTQTTLDETGAPRRRLTAQLLVHYPDDDSSELVRPALELYNGSPQPWRVIAERGWVSAGAEVVVLYGAVEIWRLDERGQRALEVHTRDLRILTDDQYAESDNPTTIRSPTTTTHAIGMRADFGVRRLELLKEVRTRHEG